MTGDRESGEERVDDDLARRLRALDWPAPPPGLRERALEDFKRRLAEAEREAGMEPDAAHREH